MHWQMVAMTGGVVVLAWLCGRGDRLNKASTFVLDALEFRLARQRQAEPRPEPAYEAPPPLPEWQVRLRRMSQRFETAKRAKSY